MTKRSERKKEERAIFGRHGTAQRYKLKQKMISIGDDFYIENQDGQKVFKVDGKVLRIRETLHFEDMDGNMLAQIQAKLLTIRDTMEIEDAKGKTLAKVKKALITPLRNRWTVKVPGGDDLKVQGNIIDHAYEMHAGRRKVAEVSKRWFSVRDSYGVEIAPDQNEVLILAIVVALDMMVHDDEVDKE